MLTSLASASAVHRRTRHAQAVATESDQEGSRPRITDFDHTGYTNIEKYVNGLLDGSYP